MRPEQNALPDPDYERSTAGRKLSVGESREFILSWLAA